MKTEKLLCLSSDYLNGFKDLIDCRTFKTPLIGFFKILSYTLILPPLIAGGLYLRSKTICQLQQRLDKADLTKLFAETLEADQKPLMDYLVNKLTNFEKGDDETLERSRFENGFKALTFDSQREFFLKAIKSDCLGKALMWLPSDIEELNFVSGPPNAFGDSDRNGQQVLLLFKELDRFTHLKRIELDTRGLGFYTEYVHQTMETTYVVYGTDPQRTFMVKGTNYDHFNETGPIFALINHLAKLIKKNPELAWRLRLMNSDQSGKGARYTSTDSPRYSNALCAYFEKISQQNL